MTHINDTFETDLNTYSYNEILQLFQIDELNNNTIKKAYKTVIYSHPDKSGLDKSYFIFFLKAFKLLHTILNTYNGNTSTENERSYAYTRKINPYISSNDDVYHFMKQDDFLKKFNIIFDKLDKVDDEQCFGYDAWLKNNACEKQYHVKNINEMHHTFEKEKESIQISTQSPDQNIAMVEDGYHLLSRRQLDTYDSIVFAKLQYQDLKKALSETILPVSTHSDKYVNLHEYKTIRDSETYNVDNSYAYHKQQYLAKNENIRQLYEMAIQYERQQQNQILWKSCIQQLKNDI